MAQRQRTRNPMLFLLAGAAYVLMSLTRSAVSGGRIQSFFLLAGGKTTHGGRALGYPRRSGKRIGGLGRRQGPTATQPELLDVREVWERLSVEFPQLADFLCPITKEVMSDPVTAEDGYTYERANIEQWLTREAISPMTMEPMGARVEANGQLCDALGQFRQLVQRPSEMISLQPEYTGLFAVDQSNAGAARIVWKVRGRHCDDDVEECMVDRSLDVGECLEVLRRPEQPISKEEEALKRVFQEMSGVEDLLEEVLDGLAIPRVVMLGMESSGKSTLLEQLFGMPILPRAKRFCTRLAIRLRLRTDKESKAEMSVLGISLSGESLEKGPRRIPMSNGAAFVQQEMDTLVEELGDAEKNGDVLSNTIIDVEIRRPDVLNIDLVDLPGLTTLPGPKQEVLEHIVNRQLANNRLDGGNSLFVVVLPEVRANTNLAVGRIVKEALENQTLGVISKADLAEDSGLLWSVVLGEDIMEGSAKELGHVPLKGWYTTSLKPPKTNTRTKTKTKRVCGAKDKARTKAETTTTTRTRTSSRARARDGELGSFERLLRQQGDEEVFFQGDEDLEDLWSQGVAGVPALRNAVAKAYYEQFNVSWKPSAMEILFKKLEKTRYKRAMLGVGDPEAEFGRRLGPRAQESYKRAMSAVVKKFMGKLEGVLRRTGSSGESSAAEAVREVLQGLQGYMDDAKSELWRTLRKIFQSAWQLEDFGEKDLALALPWLQLRQRLFLQEHPSEKDREALKQQVFTDVMDCVNLSTTTRELPSAADLQGLIWEAAQKAADTLGSIEFSDRQQRRLKQCQNLTETLGVLNEIRQSATPVAKASNQRRSDEPSLTVKRRVIQAFDQGSFCQFVNYGVILYDLETQFTTLFRHRMDALLDDIKRLQESHCKPWLTWTSLESQRPCLEFDERRFTEHVEELLWQQLPVLTELQFPQDEQLHSVRKDVSLELQELDDMERKLLRVQEFVCKAFEISQEELQSRRRDYEMQNP